MAFNLRSRVPSADRTRHGVPHVSTQDWVARIRAGDEAAFEAMFRTYYDRLCRYVAPYLGSRDAAEDAVQGVFVRIWEDRARWAVSDLPHYLYAAVRRPAISQIRRPPRRGRAAPLLMLEEAGAPSAASAGAPVEAEGPPRGGRRGPPPPPPPPPPRVVPSPPGGVGD